MLWVLIRIALALKSPCQGDSNEYPQHICLWRTIEIIFLLSQNMLHICSTDSGDMARKVDIVATSSFRSDEAPHD